MMNHARTHLLGITAAATLLAVLSGCATERDPIDRVQPNALAKSYFQGQWHYSSNVVDIPDGSVDTAIGFGNWDLKKIRWEVQEHQLLARRVTENIIGEDTEAGTDDYDGAIVAAYRIIGHFDIAKPYSTATGEEMNVLQENYIDRPWYEREFMRVDWGNNWFDVGGLGLYTFSYLEYDPLRNQAFSYFPYCEDEDRNEVDGTCNSEPDAPVFVDGYFDVTSRLVARPGTASMPQWGIPKLPLCWLFSFQDCQPAEFTIRHSFKKVAADRQYEPRTYKGTETELFGYFDTMRMEYQRSDDPGNEGLGEEGIREQNKHRYINRHDIWVKSYNADGSLIPMEQRRAKPIVYHVNRKFPTMEDDPTLVKTALRVADDWDRIFRNVVVQSGALPSTAKGVTYNNDTGAVETDSPGRMFIICHNNPVQAGDPAECGLVGTAPRMGDIRYSFLAYLPDYMTYGLLGLGPSMGDPETGELHVGQAYVYHHNDTAAYDVMQMIKLLGCDWDSEEDAADCLTFRKSFIDGLDLTDWVEEVQAGYSSRDMGHSLADARYMVEKMVNSTEAAALAATRQPPSAEDEAFMQEHGTKAWLRNFMPQFEDMGIVQKQDGVERLRMLELAGTEIEGMLLTDDMLDTQGIERANLTQALEERGEEISPLRGSVKLYEQRQAMREAFAEKNNMYLREMADDALLGLAREYKNSNLTDVEIYQEVRSRIYTAVISHELGHSLGLMHNFGASDDAVNYFPKYWELRTADGSVGPRIDNPMTGTPADTITDAEINGGIYNYGYSSVMDYAGRYTIDGTGLGRYDEAVMMWGYADKVQVFNNIGQANAQELDSWADDDGDVLLLYNSGPATLHYTALYNKMGDYMYREDNRAWVDMSDLTADYSETTDGRARVPYVYCSHGRSNLGDSCLTRDFGADSYERLSGIMDDINTWYITRNFPRGKVSNYFDDTRNYTGRYMRRTYSRLKQWHDIYGLYKQILPQYYTPEQLEEFYLDPYEGYGAQTAAVNKAFNFLIQVLFTPDLQGYTSTTDVLGNEMLTENPWMGGDTWTGNVTNSRYYQTSWSYGYNGERDCGYYWYDCFHHYGYYLDKMMAIFALTDSETNFVARSSPKDLREWKVGYFNTFRDQILNVNRALMAQDYSVVGPYLEDGEVKYPNYSGALTTPNNTGGNQLVDPAAGFTVQLYWNLLGNIFFSGNFDDQFALESSIWLYDADSEFAPEDRIAKFRDPDSFFTYAAIEYDGAGAAEQMLARANELFAVSDLCSDENRPEWVATCDDPPYTVEFGSDDATSLANAKARATVELRKYMQMIKIAKIVGGARYSFGHPFNP